MAGILKRLFSRPNRSRHSEHLVTRDPVVIPDPYARLDLQHLFHARTDEATTGLRELEQALRKRLRREADRSLTLPRQPAVLPQLIRWLNDDSVSHRQLAATIEADPALSAALLRLANSVYFRVGTEPVETIPRAIAVVGLDGLRRLVAAALTMPVVRGQGRDPLRESLWAWALSAGELSRQVAQYTGADEASLYLATLIAAIGYLTVYLNARELGAERNLPANRVQTLVPPLIMAFRFDVAQRIADHWHLSPELRNAMRELRNDAPRQPGSLAHGLAMTLQCAHLRHLHGRGALDEEEVRRFTQAQAEPEWYDRLFFEPVAEDTP
ncbi:MAG: HDOD domain-containing protein [Gammaproteobacteria bacterium]|nr:MAG: HDOD domain-containing protein [Gammaproteobacteria bacterium]